MQASDDVRRETGRLRDGFSAYGVTQNDDPLSQAMRGLIDNAASHEHQIAHYGRLSKKSPPECRIVRPLPEDATRNECYFEAEKFSGLLGK